MKHPIEIKMEDPREFSCFDSAPENDGWGWNRDYTPLTREHLDDIEIEDDAFGEDEFD